MTEQDKFLAWHAQEKKEHGLLDIKFFVGEGSATKTATAEDFFREANLTNELYKAGKVVQRDDVF